MRLEEYIAETKEDLDLFAASWRAAHATRHLVVEGDSSDAVWPTDMPSGEWDEAFRLTNGSELYEGMNPEARALVDAEIGQPRSTLDESAKWALYPIARLADLDTVPECDRDLHAWAVLSSHDPDAHYTRGFHGEAQRHGDARCHVASDIGAALKLVLEALPDAHVSFRQIDTGALSCQGIQTSFTGGAAGLLAVAGHEARRLTAEPDATPNP